MSNVKVTVYKGVSTQQAAERAEVAAAKAENASVVLEDFASSVEEVKEQILATGVGLPETLPVPGSNLSTTAENQWTILGPGVYHQPGFDSIEVPEGVMKIVQSDGNSYSKEVVVELPVVDGARRFVLQAIAERDTSVIKDSTRLVLKYLDRIPNSPNGDLWAKKRALIEMFNRIEEAGFLNKILMFFPFMGDDSTVGYNLIDSDFDAIEVPYNSARRVYEGGLMAGTCKLKIDGFTLHNISYLPNGAADCGAGLYFTENYHPDTIASDIESVDGFSVFIQFRQPSPLAGIPYILLGNNYNDQNSLETISSEGGYYHAQRFNNSIGVFKNTGIVTSSSRTVMENKQITGVGTNGSIVLQNIYPGYTGGTRAWWITKSFTDEEERLFFNLIKNFNDAEYV